MLKNCLIFFILTFPLIGRDFDIHTYLPLAQAMDEFNRRLAGCPKTAIHIEECIPGAGIFDAKLWKKVRKLAKQAFDLQERSQGVGPSQGSEKDLSQNEQ